MQLAVNFDKNRVLSMLGPKRKWGKDNVPSRRMERLSIRGDYPWNSFSEQLFASLGTMHLVAPHLPNLICTNFSISAPMIRLFREMYRYERAINSPFFIYPNGLSELVYNTKTSKKKVVIAYSAGKDSIWNYLRAVKKYGKENVLVVHIRNLNRGQGFSECESTLKQQKQFGFKLAVIDLKNSCRNNGYATMRSRDMFLAGLIIPIAIEFGAGKIITEGFAEGGEEPFTGQEENMVFFNQLLKEAQIPVQVWWENRSEMLIIKDLYRNHPEWMPHLCNCFCWPQYKSVHQGFWHKRTPSFQLYDSQCGHCVKCRIINVARVLYDPNMAQVKPEDIRKFLEGTDVWIRNEGLNTHADMIGKSFMRCFSWACRLWGVKPSCLNKLKN